MKLKQEQKDFLKKARDEGKIIHTCYQDMYWFPNELEKDWKQEKFQWSLENFSLEEPKDRLEMYKEDINKAKYIYSIFKSKYVEYLKNRK